VAKASVLRKQPTRAFPDDFRTCSKANSRHPLRGLVFSKSRTKLAEPWLRLFKLIASPTPNFRVSPLLVADIGHDAVAPCRGSAFGYAAAPKHFSRSSLQDTVGCMRSEAFA